MGALRKVCGLMQIKPQNFWHSRGFFIITVYIHSTQPRRGDCVKITVSAIGSHRNQDEAVQLSNRENLSLLGPPVHSVQWQETPWDDAQSQNRAFPKSSRRKSRGQLLHPKPGTLRHNLPLQKCAEEGDRKPALQDVENTQAHADGSQPRGSRF